MPIIVKAYDSNKTTYDSYHLDLKRIPSIGETITIINAPESQNIAGTVFNIETQVHKLPNTETNLYGEHITILSIQKN